MDNLTHSLIGAALGQAGLKRKTGLAMPALIIAANLPDIDAACFFWLDGTEHLGFRRGITHGPIALALLPLLLAGALWSYDRWQTRRGTRPAGRLPVHFGWLFALSLIGCLSHPLFDWFNNYGVRLLEPFSSQWFYGDTLFIIDPWIIAMLGAGVWFSLRRERTGRKSWSRPSVLALAGTAAFVLLNMGISSLATERFRTVFSVEFANYRESYSREPRAVVANAVPLAFWKREVLWRVDSKMTGPAFGSMAYNLFSSRSRGIYRDSGARHAEPLIRGEDRHMSDPRIAEWSKGDRQAQAFLFWSRMPIAELHSDRIVLRDQRFMDPRVVDRFSVTMRPPQQ